MDIAIASNQRQGRQGRDSPATHPAASISAVPLDNLAASGAT
nr:hypothetical protein [Bradyrhizobium sp. ORS 278]